MFLIILCLVLILAIFMNYLLRDKNPQMVEPPFIEPLKQNFKPIITDLYNEDADEAHIQSNYESLLEKESVQNAERGQVNTVNMFVESHYELNLSLFGKGPTIDMVHEAYENLLNEHVQSIAKGIKPSFDISTKKRAKEYLIAHFDSLNT